MAVQPDYSDGCMLALYPDEDLSRALALPGGLPWQDLHLTIAYCGDAADVDPDRLLAAAKAIRAAPFTARISGSARFTGGEQDVLVALVDAAELDDLRNQALTALAAHGIEVPREHGFTAHVTRCYLPADQPDDTGRLGSIPARFATLSVAHGRERTDIPLTAAAPPPTPGDTLAEAVRDAYARGWAESGGPMTERVKQGCATAIAMAREHPDRPNLLEASLDLGHLEGTWARVYHRRDQLIARHTLKADAALKTLITRKLVAAAVHSFRTHAGLSETVHDRDWRMQIKAAATAAATLMLQALAYLPEWRILRANLRDALAAGRAEGIVGAVALAAEETGRLGLDWDLAFDHAYQALERLDELWSDADGWLGRMLDRAAGDLGRVLAQGAADGASYESMVADAMDVLDSADVEAVSFTVDWAMTVALRQGAIDLYASEGVASVSWISAGDSRVCSTCESNEAGSPYAPADVPAVSHPRCRCTVAASFDLANFASWFTD